MEEQLLETWAIHNRINLYMLDAIPDDALGASLPTKSRTVYDLFAHIHNVRLLWLKAAAPPSQMASTSSKPRPSETSARFAGARIVGPGDREPAETGARRRRKDQRVQAACGRISRVPDLTRITPPRSGRLGPQVKRQAPRSKNRLRPLGMGRALIHHNRDQLTRATSRSGSLRASSCFSHA